MKLYAGVDGGQSSTRAVVGDATGTIFGYGSSGAADEVGAGSDSTKLRDAIDGAIADALANAQLEADVQFEHVVAGISGYEGALVGAAPAIATQRLTLVHDGVIAYAGALGEASGVTIIAGTGSVAIAKTRSGVTRTVGGWGYLFGDEGSAFWIARRCFERAVEHEPCASSDAIRDYFATPTLRDIARAFYNGRISRERFARYATRAIDDARTGRACGCASKVVTYAIRALARLAELARRDDCDGRIAFVGGLLHDAWLRERVRVATQTLIPDADVVEPLGEPVVGALMVARLT